MKTIFRGTATFSPWIDRLEIFPFLLRPYLFDNFVVIHVNNYQKIFIK